MRLVIDLRQVDIAAEPALFAIAEGIAEVTSQRAKDHEYAESVHAVLIPGGARVKTDNSFAHLDEFGSINNPPTGAMRSAADEVGYLDSDDR